MRSRCFKIIEVLPCWEGSNGVGDTERENERRLKRARGACVNKCVRQSCNKLGCVRSAAECPRYCSMQGVCVCRCESVNDGASVLCLRGRKSVKG